MSSWLLFTQINVMLLACYLIYTGIFARLRNFRFNRILLLAIPVLAVCLPFIKLQLVSGMARDFNATIVPMNVIELPAAIIESGLDWTNYLFFIYLSGFGISLVALFFRLVGLRRFLKRQTVMSHQHYRLITSESPISSFSFFNTIYLNSRDASNQEAIILHERQHIRLGHSYDNLYFELMKCLFWFNPAIYVLHRQVRNNHEFEVDALMVEALNSTTYLDKILNGNEILREMKLTNPFYTKHNLLKRLNIMHKATSPDMKWYYFLIIPTVIGLIFLNACSDDMIEHKEITETQQQDQAGDAGDIVPPDQMKELTEMAKFPGGMPALGEFLGKEIKYPSSAREEGVEGKVMVSFIVSANGDIINAKVEKGVDERLDAEALRAVNAMPKWTPAEKDNKKVGVHMLLPIQFKL